MKYFASIAAAAIMAIAFNASAVDTTQQQLEKIKPGADTSEFDTLSRKCPPFCV